MLNLSRGIIGCYIGDHSRESAITLWQSIRGMRSIGTERNAKPSSLVDGNLKALFYRPYNKGKAQAGILTY